MSKRTIQYGLVLLILVAGGSLLFPAIRYPLMGWLRGEKFIEGYPVSYWLREAENRDSEAIKNLGQSDACAVPVLLKVLLEEGNTVSQARTNSAKALGQLGPAAKSALPELMHVLFKREMIRGNTSTAYCATVEALKEMGPAAAEDVPQLRLMLSPATLDRADDVIVILSCIGDAAKPAAPELLVFPEKYPGSPESQRALSVLASWDVDEAIPMLFMAYEHVGYSPGWVNSALMKFYHRQKAVVPAAITALDRKSRSIRYHTANLLGEIGPGARQAVPALKALLQDEYLPNREVAEKAIRKIESTSSVPNGGQ